MIIYIRTRTPHCWGRKRLLAAHNPLEIFQGMGFPIPVTMPLEIGQMLTGTAGFFTARLGHLQERDFVKASLY